MTIQPDHDPVEEELRRFLEVERPDVAERIARYERDKQAGTLKPGIPHKEVRRRLGMDAPSE
ncbi:MAG TPA: hypothetical protein VN193_12365 [Candidatus Angelobacter sp.]|jgi:hypothetical protein|nr:hypothetical protein [Candidatus Angelobacter sp.]